MPKGLKGFQKGNKISVGNKNINWKGSNVGYYAVHAWIARWKGLPTTCEWCGKTNLKNKHIDWANIDHTYKRVLDDYIRLCRSCHRQYDYEHNLKPDNKIGTNQYNKKI